MLIHQSEYIGEVTLSDVKAELEDLNLNDEYKTQFRTLIGTLIAN